MAQARYDLEQLLVDVLGVMTTNLNTKISAIDAEKTAAGYTLAPALATIDSNAYYVQSWTNKILNFTPAIFYGIETVKPMTSGQITAETVTVFVTTVYLDNGNSNDAYQRILRYIRALKEIFEENFSAAKSGSKIKIETLSPISFKLDENSSEEIKVGGVSLTVALA